MSKDTKKVDVRVHQEIEESFLVENEYHFPGGGEYYPVTVKASSVEEATAEWEKVRVPVASTQPETLQDKDVLE